MYNKANAGKVKAYAGFVAGLTHGLARKPNMPQTEP